jgi:hypothetical protein
MRSRLRGYRPHLASMRGSGTLRAIMAPAGSSIRPPGSREPQGRVLISAQACTLSGVKQKWPRVLLRRLLTQSGPPCWLNLLAINPSLQRQRFT